MTRKRPIDLLTAFLVAGLIWVAASAPAQATTMRRMDLPEVVNKADRVLHAVAVETRVYWDNDYRKIYTDTTFEVLENTKGMGSPRVTVTMLGGTLNDFNMLVEGTPIFRTGEEVIIFTSPRPGGKKNLVGFSQGLMRIQEDPETGRKMARSFMPTGVTYLDRAGGRKVNRNPRVAELGEMKEELRRLVDTKEPSKQIESRPSTIDNAIDRRVP